jgi:hypothetical protein
MSTVSFTRTRGAAVARWSWLVVGLWAAILIGSCARYFIKRSDNSTLFDLYTTAGRNWLAGADLYPARDNWLSFLYSPAAAVTLTPYSVLQPRPGNVLWQLTLIGGYLLALHQWLRSALPVSLTWTQQALIYGLVLPVTVMTMLDGQAGALVAAAVLLTIAAAAEDRWGHAAAFGAFACLFKVYPIALVLLLAVAFPRRAILPVAVALVVGLALPFLFQRPAYVADQYAKWFKMMTESERQYWPLDIANRNFALLFQARGTALSRNVWQVVQLGTAAAAAALCFAASRAGWQRRPLLLLVQGLAVCWMTLFGPAVESFTYILVGPTLAWMLVEAWQRRSPLAYRALLAASWAIFTSATLSVTFMHSIRYHRLGPHPVAGLLLLAAVLTDATWQFRQRGAVAAADDSGAVFDEGTRMAA